MLQVWPAALLLADWILAQHSLQQGAAATIPCGTLNQSHKYDACELTWGIPCCPEEPQHTPPPGNSHDPKSPGPHTAQFTRNNHHSSTYCRALGLAGLCPAVMCASAVLRCSRWACAYIHMPLRIILPRTCATNERSRYTNPKS